MLKNEYLKKVYADVEKRNAGEPEFLQARCLVASSAHIYTCNSSSLIYEVRICMHSILQSLFACHTHEFRLCLCLGHLFRHLTHLFCGSCLSHSV